MMQSQVATHTHTHTVERYATFNFHFVCVRNVQNEELLNLNVIVR